MKGNVCLDKTSQPHNAYNLQFKQAETIYQLNFRNSVPQSPNFPLANISARNEVLEKVTEMFHQTFPYTTVYPALGNLVIR